MFKEKNYAGEHLLTEISGLSRDDVVIAKENLGAATVLGKVTASGDHVQLAPGAADGSQDADAILYADTNASVEPKKAVANARLTAVRAATLVWPKDISDTEKATAIAQLSVKHIVLR